MSNTNAENNASNNMTNNLNKIVDPAIEAVRAALGQARFKYVQDQLQEILRESVSEYAKKFKLEYLLQSLMVGIANSGDALVSVGPCHVPENKDVRTHHKAVTFSDHMWTARALAYESTRDFFDKVLKMNQAVLNHANLASPPPSTAGGVPSETNLEQGKMIATLMDNITDDHYSLVSLAFLLYGFLDSLYLEYKPKKFLFLMSQIRSAVFHYNAHHPGSHPHLEMSALYEMRKLLAIKGTALNYLRSNEFYQVIQGGEKAITAAPSAKAKAEAMTSLWSAIPTQQAEIPAAASKMEIKTDADGVPVSAVYRIRAEEVKVDISRSRPLPDVINEIGTNISRVIDHALGECTEILRVAQAANYNLANGQWGSFFALADNEKHMRAIEPIIFQETGAVALDLLPPRFFFITHYTTIFVPTRLSFSTVAHTEGVKPGQTIKYRVTTGTTTKESTAKNQSIAETQTQEAQDDYQDELATTMAEKNTRSTDDQRYVESASSIATSQAQDFGAYLDVSVGKSGASGALGFSVEGGMEYNCSSNTDMSQDRSQNVTAQVQTEREVSNEVQKKALAKHNTKKGSTRQTNVAVATEVSSEQTKQESRDEEFTNPSTIAPMTVFFLKLVQEYVAIRAITGFSIVFANGVDFREYEVTDFNSIMSEYLEVDRADVQKEIEAFRNLIRIAATGRDYRRRVVRLLEENSLGNFEFRPDPYFLLVDGGLDEQDIDIMPVKERVFGCVLSVEPFRMPSAGYFTVCIMGPPVLDENAQRMYEASLLARDLENSYKDATIKQVCAATEILVNMAKFIFSIKEVNDVVKFQKEAMFELLKENKEMWDKRELRHLFLDPKKDKDEDDLFKGAK